MQQRVPVVLMLAGLVTLGCGSSDTRSTGTSASTSTSNKARQAGPPARLLGTYTTTLKAGDIPASHPAELRDQRRWTLKITKDGGIDNAPTLTIVRPPTDVLESSTLAVSGDTLRLTNEECAQGGGTPVRSAYRWTLSGDTLRLKTAQPGCPDRVAQTILTSEPWTRR